MACANYYITLNPMWHFAVESMAEELDGAINSGLLSEEEAARALHDFAVGEIEKYMEFEAS